MKIKILIFEIEKKIRKKIKKFFLKYKKYILNILFLKLN
jgi:hypothetical protein